MSAATELYNNSNNKDKSNNASELSSFAAIVEDAVDEGFLLDFNIPGRFLTAALSAIMSTLPKHGTIIYCSMVLAEAAVKRARKNNITFTR